MKLLSRQDSNSIRDFSAAFYLKMPCSAERYTLYDTTSAINRTVDFFISPVGSLVPYSPHVNKTLADTNMELAGMLPPMFHFIVTRIEVEESYPQGYRPLNTRGFLKMLVGSTSVVGYPTDIVSEEMPTIYIPPKCNFCVTLGGEIVQRDPCCHIFYRCRLGGVMYKELQ